MTHVTRFPEISCARLRRLAGNRDSKFVFTRLDIQELLGIEDKELAKYIEDGIIG